MELEFIISGGIIGVVIGLIWFGIERIVPLNNRKTAKIIYFSIIVLFLLIFNDKIFTRSLSVTVAKIDNSLLTIQNNEKELLTEIEVTINTDYNNNLIGFTAKPGETIPVITSECVNERGERFDPYRMVVKQIKIHARSGSNKIRRFGKYGWN